MENTSSLKTISYDLSTPKNLLSLKKYNLKSDSMDYRFYGNEKLILTSKGY